MLSVGYKEETKKLYYAFKLHFILFQLLRHRSLNVNLKTVCIFAGSFSVMNLVLPFQL